MDKVKVNIKNPPNDKLIPVGTRLLVRKTCIATLQEIGFCGDSEIDVIFVNNKTMKEYNKAINNSDDLIDFLVIRSSISNSEKIFNKTLGTIVISIERVTDETRKSGYEFRYELCRIIISSIFELTSQKFKNTILRKLKTEKILKELGVIAKIYW